MLCNNVPLTAQQFEQNLLSQEFPGAVWFLNLFKTPCLCRGYLTFFLWFLKHRVFDKFIQFTIFTIPKSKKYNDAEVKAVGLYNQGLVSAVVSIFAPTYSFKFDSPAWKC